jgi:hypothetical protein
VSCRQFRFQPFCRAILAARAALDTNKAWTMKALMINTARLMSPAPRLRKWLLVTGVIATLPITLGAQNLIPQSGEYSLTGPLNGDQTAPRAAISGSGGWQVWQDNGIDGNGLGIGARRLNAALTGVGVPIRVNEVAAGDQEKPTVALIGGGGAVVAWQGGRPGVQNIYARFLNENGSFATRDLLVNEPARSGAGRYSTNWSGFRNNRPITRTQRLRRIIDQRQERTGSVTATVLANGNAVIAYASGRRTHERTQVPVNRIRFVYNRFITNTVPQFIERDEDSLQDVYFQIFTPSGEKSGGEIRVNQFLDFNQRNPSVAALPDGTFVVTWISENQHLTTNESGFVYRVEGSLDVMARRFDGNGNGLGDEFVINSELRPCGNPSVAGHSDSSFTIVWAQRSDVRTNSLDVYARTLSAAGNPVGSAFRVNSHEYGDQFLPVIASTTSGQMVAWTSLAQDGSREGIYARWLNNGALAGDEFRVNETTYLRQFHPAVAADETGRFFAVWASYQTSAAFDVFGRRYVAP